jgi:hypothetical protein
MRRQRIARWRSQCGAFATRGRRVTSADSLQALGHGDTPRRCGLDCRRELELSRAPPRRVHRPSRSERVEGGTRWFPLLHVMRSPFGAEAASMNLRWPRWMRSELKSADFIVLICTPTFTRRFEGKEKPGEGLGASWEDLLPCNCITRVAVTTSASCQCWPPEALPRIYRWLSEVGHATSLPRITTSVAQARRARPRPHPQ